ncbi:MAG: hypothetical protein NT140_09665 [Deltaproteobacteria bacterium]|nr:hypothetical protein [Deltaproteobacteria bacterium]
MKWLYLIAAFLLIMICTMIFIERQENVVAQGQGPQLQVSIDTLKDFPTAAGKKK